MQVIISSIVLVTSIARFTSHTDTTSPRIQRFWAIRYAAFST